MTDDRLKKIADEPAFPRINGQNFHEPGLTKREYFAAMAMQGMLSNKDTTRAANNSSNSREEYLHIISLSAIHQADALIKELNK